MVENGRLPSHDLFTYTVPSHVWTDHEYLAEILMWLTYSAAGLAVLCVAFGIVTWAGFWLIYRQVRRQPFVVVGLGLTVGQLYSGVTASCPTQAGGLLGKPDASSTAMNDALLVNPPWKIWAAHYTLSQWVFLFVFACVSMLVPYLLYFAGLHHLDATRAIVVSCLEPVFAIGFAWAFVHEGITVLQVLGMVIVIAATIIVQLTDASTQKLTRIWPARMRRPVIPEAGGHAR